MRVRDASGNAGVLTIVVTNDGMVCASLGATAIRLEPREVSKLVDLYRQAQAQAMQIRGW